MNNACRAATPFAVVTMLVAVAGTARADDAPSSVPPKHAPIDYDHRAPEGESAGDVALWVPRIVLYPLYVVGEYLVRRPFGALVTWAERNNLPRVLYDFFTFGEDHKAGFAPIVLIDFGFDPSIGAYFFWDDAGTKGHSLSIHASTWGEDWLAASIRDRYRWSDREAVTLRLTGFSRPDNQYFGTGPLTADENRSRYGETKLEASLLYERRFGKYGIFEAGAAVRNVAFRPSDFANDPSIDTRVANGAFARPDGYVTGYTAEVNRLRLAADTRGAGPNASRSGFRFDAEAEQGADPVHGNYAWLRYDAIARGMLDLTGTDRVVSLSLASFFADPLGRNATVPFTELVALGGLGPMPSFVPGRLYGRSALVSTMKYQWPVWIWLRGEIQASVGNVYDAHLENFMLTQSRFASAIGVSTIGDSDNPVEILFGVGSEPFDRGGKIDSFRFTIGTNHGY